MAYMASVSHDVFNFSKEFLKLNNLTGNYPENMAY